MSLGTTGSRPAVADASDAVPPLTTLGVFEMVLEVADLARAERFYHEVLGLSVVERWGDERPATWLALGREGFLGLWSPESGGAAAIHDGRGGRHVHFALRIRRGTADAAEERLQRLGYTIERRDFAPGDVSLYVTDPDGHCVELAERVTLWDGTAATE